MDINPLIKLASAKIASLLKGKTTLEIRKDFNIEGDFTQEEEQQMIKEEAWVFENL